MASQQINGSMLESLPGIGISLGAGVGFVIGLSIAGPPGLALGAGIGAAVGLLVGAIARDRFIRR